MNAKEAEELSIKMKPIYEDARNKKAYELIIGLITAAAERGECSISRNDLGSAVYNTNALDILVTDGYYVKQYSNGCSSTIDIAWGSDILKFIMREVKK